jgi:hypothetical protein
MYKIKCYRCDAPVVYLPIHPGNEPIGTKGLMPVNAGTVDKDDKIYQPFVTQQAQDEKRNWNYASVAKHVSHWKTCRDAKP